MIIRTPVYKETSDFSENRQPMTSLQPASHTVIKRAEVFWLLTFETIHIFQN